MNVPLLDVNVLVSLFDPEHVHHEAAHLWFSEARELGWATCPLTENGLVRILSNPVYHPTPRRSSQVVAQLAALCDGGGHQFWPDDLSLRDRTRFVSSMPISSRQLTDAYLLALAVQRDGQLVTFDRAVPLGAVAGARPRHLILLSP